MNRRRFIINSSFTMLGLSLFNKKMNGSIKTIDGSDEIRDYIKKILYTREEIDAWFAGKSFPFSKYNSELGWLLNSNSFQDGINNSWSIYTYEGEDGERIMTNYKGKICRINTYGNSFTQCHQVSDHETWQEVLAGHLQEPVRNFGVGAWSVYQAYLRMLKEEKRTPAKYLIFNIFEDDHLRNLDSWRNIRNPKHPQHIEATLPYIKCDIKKETIIECKNPCPTPESFYKLCDLDKTYELFKDDFVLKIMIAHEKSAQINPDKMYQKIMELTKTDGIETKIETGATLSEVADKLHRQVALFSTQRIINKIEEYAKINNKKVLYVLSYPALYYAKYFSEGYRWDQSFINFLKKQNLPFVDLSQPHLNEFKQTKVGIEEYLSKYFIGHYNPLGNFFCADALRDKIVEMLVPKPFSYRYR